MAEVKDYKLGNHTLQLLTSHDCFLPNVTTARFARGINGESNTIEGKVVADIGTGVGPLAIWAALEGAKAVYAVDPVAQQIELARENVKRYGLEDRIHIYQGSLFDPIPDLKPDVIIGDVSGIAQGASWALGWYPKDVPTGGEDGTEVISAFLQAARAHVNNGTVVYFPAALDLSDSEKLVHDDAKAPGAPRQGVADRLFRHVQPTQPTIKFPLLASEVEALQKAYSDGFPAYISPQVKGSRAVWRGQIYRAHD